MRAAAVVQHFALIGVHHSRFKARKRSVRL